MALSTHPSDLQATVVESDALEGSGLVEGKGAVRVDEGNEALGGCKRGQRGSRGLRQKEQRTMCLSGM